MRLERLHGGNWFFYCYLPVLAANYGPVWEAWRWATELMLTNPRVWRIVINDPR